LPAVGQARRKPALRPPMGTICTAALEILRESDGPLRPKEIHARVELHLDRTVSRHTIASFLSRAAQDATSPVVRSGRSGYELQPRSVR
jgi:hypothetical protein